MGPVIDRKRPRSSSSDNRAQCPFSIKMVTKPHRDTPNANKKRKRTPTEDKHPSIQISPFLPTGKFRTHETLDLHYEVQPARQWQEMTCYNCFELNGTKYYSEGFVFVANEDTVAHHTSGKAMANSTSDGFWVARILEIRAQDQYHVYARVYWMYKPADLPSHTLNGKKVAGGRHPYHGANELLASNHMDVINVVSVSMPAEVNHWIEADDDEDQSELYWRQAFDIRTSEISTAKQLCSCNEPANPDKTLIGCTNDDCGIWMHHDCLYDAVLCKVHARLGCATPHSEKGDVEEEDDKNIAATVARGKMAKLPTKKKVTKQSTTSNTPYLGLFEANLQMNHVPVVWEITDLRSNIHGGVKKWNEVSSCLKCNHMIE